MKKTIIMLFAVILFSINYGHAQDRKISVETDNSSFNVQNAYLNKVMIKDGRKMKEVFQLFFSIPNQLELSLPQTATTLTAYKKDGSVFGMSSWCSMDNISTNKISAESLQIMLNVDSKLQGASRYVLSVNQKESSSVERSAGSCDECANLAVRICGAGSVGSVTCPTNPKDTPATPCSFTCQP